MFLFLMRQTGSPCPVGGVGISLLVRAGLSHSGSFPSNIICSELGAGSRPMPLQGGTLKRELRQPQVMGSWIFSNGYEAQARGKATKGNY